MKWIRAALATALLSCSAGGTPAGVAPSAPGSGPVVRFDLFARPMPEIPLPNDLAARPDPDSPTGMRLNASHVAATAMEEDIRRQLDTLDGWGTFATMSVAFDCEGDSDGICLDLDEIMRRHPRGVTDLEDDVLYIVDITPSSPSYGQPIPVDLGQGHFPLRIDRSTPYYDNDRRVGSTNILYDDVGEVDVDGDGEPDPDEDTNGDGRLSVANVWPPGSDAADNLVTFYEMTTDTLTFRPVVPLRGATTYAVILTDRLGGEHGPVRSPFPWINHVDQTADLSVLPQILESRPGSFGGITIDDVRFAWSFTTQSTTLDLRELRRGLYGHGPFSRLAEKYPPDLVVNQFWGCNPFGPGDCDLPANLFVLGMEDFARAAGPYLEDIFGDDLGEMEPALDTFLYLDYMIIGHFYSPNFLDSDGDGLEEARWKSEDIDGDGRLDVAEDENFNGRLDPGEDVDGDGHLDRDEDLDGDGELLEIEKDEGVWRLNPLTGEGRESPGWVSVFITVPKEDYRPAPDEPFPVVFYGHGYTSFNLEAFGFAGNLAKLGFATVGVNCVHHGLGFDELIMDTVRSVFQEADMAPGGAALVDDRAIDPDRDGVKDSGGDFWTSYVMHTRDVVRQSALDHFQFIRILRSFDGVRRAGPVDHDGDGEPESHWDYESWSADGPARRLVGDFDGDGTVELAGDFDADGRVDVGGPDGRYYVWGQSLGGIMSALMGGLDPAIRAIAPTSGGGGLGDIAVRGQPGGTRNAVVLRIHAPLVVTAPVSESMVEDDRTRCAAGQVSLRFMMPDVNDETRMEFACLEASETTDGTVMVVENHDNGEARCAAFHDGGRVRIPVPADFRDPLTVSLWAAGEVGSTDGCAPLAGAMASRVIDAFEVDARYQYFRFYEGERLIAPTEGYGMERNTPDFRRLFGLAQIAVDPADPINYAPHYFLSPIDHPEEDGGATDALIMGTAGDMVVPINTAISQARAAGILDFESPDPRIGKTPSQVLIDNWVAEAIEQYGRTYPDDGSGRCRDTGCDLLFDPDDVDRDTDGHGSPHLTDPLRVFRPSVPDDRLAEALDRCSVETSTEGGRTFLEKVVCPDGVSAFLVPVIFPDGEHGFYVPDPELPFDVHTFLVNMVGRYFMTDGTELNYSMCMHDNTCDWIPPLPPKPPDWPI
jgi:hypothetical protein